MPGAPAKATSFRISAALAVVALAIVLAAVGLVLAIRQTQLLADQRIAAARSEAERLAADLHEKVSRRATDALGEVADVCRADSVSGPPEADPLGGRRRPTWLGDLFFWDGRNLRYWPGLQSSGGSDASDDERTERLKQLVTGRLLSHLLLAYVGTQDNRALLLEDTIGDQPVVLAHMVADAPQQAPFLVAAALDTDRLRRSYLIPLVSDASQRLRLVNAAAATSTWSERLAPGLSFWALQPTRQFVEAERKAVKRQTGIFVAITVLALLALLVVVWGLVHVVQREMALSQLKSSFVADVSHELKTPLALIRLFGETLAEGRVESPEKQHEYYEIIKRESTRLTHLINNILDFSRIEAGRKQYKMAEMDVGEVVRSTYESYRYDLEHHGFEHHLTVASDLPQIHGDPDAISQVLLNLMGNAVKYYDDERHLAVEVARETRRGRHGVLISVRDRGIGLPPEARRYLFDGFYRATDERVRKRRGTGLGLSVVKHIVDAHGGSIDVESRLVKGSTFRIFLPEMQAGKEGTGREGTGQPPEGQQVI
ncbi:MAG: sensor histidine kinase [Planctomycetota bacterium]|jgi:signal transduction histidine kinase